MNRHDLIQLIPPCGLAAELGVAEGRFSEEILMNHPTVSLVSVDRWAGDRGHGNRQYSEAKLRLRRFMERSSILRKPFDVAIEDFPDGSLDFVYIDSYAHTGQDDGRTLDMWWPKVKVGGYMAGHDYDPAWPQTVRVVDAFIGTRDLILNITNGKDEYQSWWTQK